MHRRLPVLALASLLCLASACGRAGDLTGPAAAQPTSPRFDQVDGNGGTIGNGNFTGEPDDGGLGSGTGGMVAADGAGDGGSGGIVAAAGNGGSFGNGN